MTRPRPTGATRLFVRMPITLYRARLGWLLGQRFLLLEHTGRRSGLLRRTVLEVVARRPAGGYVVASGFGPRSDWYRNLLAHPDATIQVGLRRSRVHARTLTTEEGAETMVDYARRHSAAARRLSAYMGFTVDGTDEGYRTVGRELPFLLLAPQAQGTQAQGR